MRFFIGILFLFFITPAHADVCEDVTHALRFREGLDAALSFVASQPDIFPKQKPDRDHFLTVAQKDTVRSTWKSFMDHVLSLDSVAQRNQSFYQKSDPDKVCAFSAFYSASVANHRAAIDFIKRMDIDPALNIVLNEPAPDLGLPEKSYDKFKFRFMNVARAGEFAALQAVALGIKIPASSALRTALDHDTKALWNAGVSHGTQLTFKNGLQMVQQASFGAWLPVQTGVAEWMGDTKVHRVGVYLITKDQINRLRAKLEPGDILLERREWYLSNAGLPGFWPHAAFFIGTPDTRRTYFRDVDTIKWVRKQGIASGQLEDLLKTKFPEKYQLGLQLYEGEAPSLMEAISEGVSFTSLGHSAHADSVAALRPRLSKLEKAQAIVRAFQFQGRPYDFNFDFVTDATLVCSELVYKAYEPTERGKGLTFVLSEMLGRTLLSPNDMARQFDETYDTKAQQLDLVMFLDGHERKHQAVETDVGTFRQSHKRPKWHVWVQ